MQVNEKTTACGFRLYLFIFSKRELPSKVNASFMFTRSPNETDSPPSTFFHLKGTGFTTAYTIVGKQRDTAVNEIDYL